jgi:hypothetical protein
LTVWSISFCSITNRLHAISITIIFFPNETKLYLYDLHPNVVRLKWHRIFLHSDWQTRLCHKDFYSLLYTKIFAHFPVVTTVWFAYTTFHLTKCSLVGFIPIKLFLTDWSWLRIVSFNLEMGLMAGVTGRQGMHTANSYLIYQEVLS